MKNKTIWSIVIVIIIIAIIVYLYNNNSDKKKLGGPATRHKPCPHPCPRGKYCNTIDGECQDPTESRKVTTPKGRKEIGGLCETVSKWTDKNGAEQSSTCHGKYNAQMECDPCVPW